MTDEARVPLASAIAALREELADAVRSGEGEEIRFALGAVELELQVAVESTKDVKVGVKFWVLSGDAVDGGSSNVTQTIKLTLTAMRDTPQGPQSPVLVGSRQAGRPR